MKILIVGGLGYVGHSVIDNIKQFIKPAKISICDARWFSETNLEPKDLNDLEIFQTDKRNIKENFLKDFDAVVDLAAVSNDAMGNRFENATYEINYKATENLAKKSKLAGVKVYIFASSCSIYGYADDTPRSEISEINPITAYAKSKWKSEIILEKLASSTFKVFSLRFATACGWSPAFRADLVLNDFLVSSILNKKIEVLSDGKPWRPLISTNDMGRAITWALELKIQDYYDVFNVGSELWTFTIKELAEKVSKILNVDYSIAGKGNQDSRSYKVNFEKFNKLTQGLIPTTKFENVVLEMNVKLREHKALLIKRSKSLVRLNVLKKLIDEKKLTEDLFRK